MCDSRIFAIIFKYLFFLVIMVSGTFGFLLLDALLGADGDLAVLRADRLGPRQDVLADDEDLRQRLLHGVLEERPRPERLQRLQSRP